MNPEVMAAILPRVYPQMLDEVYAHQDAGRPTFIVSAAGNGVVEPLAARARHGRRRSAPATRSARTAPSPAASTAPSSTARARSRRCEAFAAEHEIDLAASYAYSDSVSDLPMLRAVGNPVVVNPDPPLAEIARDEGWQTLRFERLGRRLRRRSRSPCWRPSPASAARASPPAASSRPAASLVAPHLDLCQWRRSRGAEAASTRSARRSSRRCRGSRSRRSTGPRTRPPTPRRRSGRRASTPSPAAPTRRCTGAGSGRCASSPASARSRRPTSASTTCSTTARPGSRPPSTCRP